MKQTKAFSLCNLVALALLLASTLKCSAHDAASTDGLLSTVHSPGASNRKLLQLFDRQREDSDRTDRDRTDRDTGFNIPGLPQLNFGSSTSSAGAQPNIASYIDAAITGSRADAAAQAITIAPSRGDTSATASALVDLSAQGKEDAVAESFATAAAQDVAATASVLAQAAATALTQGKSSAFARSQARALSKAKSKGKVQDYTQAVAQAISQGGGSATQGYGLAFAEAAASGGDESAALAEATAVAFCSGESTATAFASAFSIAITRNSQGCLVLTQARALAIARCGGGQFTAFAEASATSQVLGLCNLKDTRRGPSAPPSFPDFTFRPLGGGGGRR